MRNRLLISTLIYLIFGALFVLPVYSAESFEFNNSRHSIGYYGSEQDEDDDYRHSVRRNRNYPKSSVNPLSVPEQLGLSSFLPIWICEGNPGSELLLKFSQQIVDISFLKCIRSVVIRC